MEEEAERRRQPPLKLEPEEEPPQEKSHKERDRERDRNHDRERNHDRDRERERDRAERRGSTKPAEPAPRGPPPPHSEEEVEEGGLEEEEEEEEYQDGEDSQDGKPGLKPTLRPITSAPSVSSSSGGATPNTPGNESPCGIIIPGENSPEVQPPEELRPKIGLSLKLGQEDPVNRRYNDSYLPQ